MHFLKKYCFFLHKKTKIDIIQINSIFENKNFQRNEDKMNRIQETQEKLREVGYLTSEKIAKLVALFKNSGEGSDRNIPIMLLHGAPGAGKTFLGESFAKMIGAKEKFIQCIPRMGAENFHKDIDTEVLIDKSVNGGLNAEVIVKCFEFYAKCNGFEEAFYEMFHIDKNKPIEEQDLKDNRMVTKMGILLQALEESQKGPVVVTIDELDKARPEVDSFLLDYSQNGRLTTGTETYTKGKYPIYLVITSNGERELSGAIKDRSRQVEIPRPEKELFLEILGLPADHYLGIVYDECPDFSIRRAKEYLKDLEFLGVEIDEDALSQYIDGDIEIDTLMKMEQMNKNGIEINIPSLKRCYIPINRENQNGWIQLLNDGNQGKFHLYTDDENQNEFFIDIDTVEQLMIARQYMKFDSYDNHYEGFFEYNMTEEEMESPNIHWCDNKNKQDGTRFGIKVSNGQLFRIAVNRGTTFVELDSATENTLENFLGEEAQKEETGYEVDMEYDDYGRDYD